MRLVVAARQRLSSQPSLQKKLAAELFGTFMFLLVGAGSAIGAGSLGSPNSGTLLIIGALANGLGLAMAVSATMGTSGGVLNPAVTLGLWVGGKFPAKDIVPYVIAQLIGAVLAGLVLVAAFPYSLGASVQWGSPTLNLSIVNATQGVAIEALLTFLLLIAVFGTAVDPRAPKIGGLGIGLAVLTDVLVGGNLTGAAMNPARAFGPMIASGFYPDYWYIYLIGPLIGAVLGGLVYRFSLQNRT